MSELKKILLIDDEANFRKLISDFLIKIFPETTLTEYDPVTRGVPDNDFNWGQYDLLILDYNLGIKETGLDWLRRYKNTKSFPTTVMLTGEGNESLAVKALKFGADDYISKNNLTKTKLIKIVSRAINQRKKQLIKEDAVLKQDKIFSKAKFYQGLESKIQNGGRGTLLIIIELDEHEILSTNRGLIVLESIIEYITNISFQYLKKVVENIQITRYRDESIAIMLDYDSGAVSASQLAESLCDLFNSSAYKEDNEIIPFIVNTGIVPSESFMNSVNQTMALGVESCRRASKVKRSLYYICESGDLIESGKSNVPEKEDVFDVELALNENRIHAKFQSIIGLSKENIETNDEIYEVSVVFVGTNGETIVESACTSLQNNPEIQRRIEQWVLRGTIARIISSKKVEEAIEQTFVVKLSGASFVDNNLIKWIKSELEIHQTHLPGKLINIVVNATDLLAYQKRVKALISYLRKTFGIGFVLDGIDTIAELKECLEIEEFDFLRLAETHAHLLETSVPDESPVKNMIEIANEHHMQTIASKIESSVMLSNAISVGFHLLQGNFIANPVDNISHTTQIESIEL